MNKDKKYVKYKLWINENESSYYHLFVYTNESGVYIEYPFLAEYVDNKVIDIVTGKEIIYSNNPFSGKLSYSSIEYVSSLEVYDFLRKFTDDTVESYYKYLDSLRTYFSVLYVNYKMKLKEDLEKEKNADLYIRDFIKKNRK